MFGSILSLDTVSLAHFIANFKTRTYQTTRAFCNQNAQKIVSWKQIKKLNMIMSLKGVYSIIITWWIIIICQLMIDYHFLIEITKNPISKNLTWEKSWDPPPPWWEKVRKSQTPPYPHLSHVIKERPLTTTFSSWFANKSL